MAVTHPTWPATGYAGAMRSWAAAAALLAFSCSKSKPTDDPVPEPSLESRPLPTADATTEPPVPEHTMFPSAAAAFEAILATNPTVIGLGEYHQTRDAAHIESAIARFDAELLDMLGDITSDLVLETYISEGKCGEAERVVSQKVPETTERPETTESEISRLIGHARALGIEPHILRMRCQDFETIVVQGEVDFDKLLVWVTGELARVCNSIVEYRRGRGMQAKDHDAKRATIAVYSGAHHNNLSPAGDMDELSYVSKIAAAIGDGYVEVDLYVPEFVRGKSTALAEPWYPLIERAAPDRVMLIERAPRSYIILLQRDRVASNARK